MEGREGRGRGRRWSWSVGAVGDGGEGERQEAGNGQVLGKEKGEQTSMSTGRCAILEEYIVYVVIRV